MKTADLEERIVQLEAELKEANRISYIHQTNSLYCSNGELHICYGLEDENELVFNVNSLFEDLPFIINQVCKEQKKEQSAILDRIKQELEDL
tara:strand:- start:458 stop:733 length:276 start_codon:yes stop_codon:yes gene_type:complete